MVNKTVTTHPINNMFRGWKMPSPRNVRAALKEAIAPWRIDDLSEGGKLAQAATARVDFNTVPGWARDNVMRQLPQIILRHGNARPHIIKEIAGSLEPAERVVELYSGGDLSGPLAMPGIEYYQVSRDPVFSGLNQLPQEFFDKVGLSELKAFDLARNFRFLTPNNIRRLTNLTYRVCPRLSFFYEEASAFGFRSEMQEQFDQAWITFFSHATYGAVINLLKTGGSFVQLETRGFGGSLPEIEESIDRTHELTKSSNSLLYQEDLSLDLSRRIFATPGYSDLALTVHIFEKIKESADGNN